MWVLLDGEASRKRLKWTILVKQILHRMFDFTLAGETGVSSNVSFIFPISENGVGTSEIHPASNGWWIWAMCFHFRVGHIHITREGKDSWSLELNQAGWSWINVLERHSGCYLIIFHVWDPHRWLSASQNTPRLLNELHCLKVIYNDLWLSKTFPHSNCPLNKSESQYFFFIFLKDVRRVHLLLSIESFM